MSRSLASQLQSVLQEVRACRVCEHWIPEPNPVVRLGSAARLLIIGQAPGTKVHATGVPWNDASGKRLRQWLSLDEATFYDIDKVAIMPMGFCYPGKGKSGDLPPRPECAPLWHESLKRKLPDIRCTLLIGQYAQNYYLPGHYKTLTERVSHWREFAPEVFVLPHPSPRNQLWLRRNSWFEEEVVPALQLAVNSLME
ncbi:MAG: uracil-DNA glycosylase family protein [Gammaproteobacteria bacterium]